MRHNRRMTERLNLSSGSPYESAVGPAHAEVFGDVGPAATMVEVSALIDPALQVEIEADAYAPEN